MARLGPFAPETGPPLPARVPRAVRIASRHDINTVVEVAKGAWERQRTGSLEQCPDAVDNLPFVNREEALEKAARVLLRNQLLTDQTKKHLVICEQLFGAGKTTFADVLGEGLWAGFGGRMLLK